MDPAIRETMLARGDVDGITGFYFTSLLNLEARGVKADIVALRYPAHGVKLYGNAIIASQELPEEEPGGVSKPSCAPSPGSPDVIADPKAASRSVKERDGIINADLENCAA
jgi:NitT/TauT family transport system substrate-binding protein